MVSVRGIPMFVGLAVAVLLALAVWNFGFRRARAADPTGDDWAGKMLVWLLVLAAFVVGAFISYTLLRP